MLGPAGPGTNGRSPKFGHPAIMKRLAPIAFLGLALSTNNTALAQGPDHVPGNIIVMLQPGASPFSLEEELAELDGKPTRLAVDRQVSAPMRAWLLHFDFTAIPEADVLRAVQSNGNVQIAQYDHYVKERIVPNDTQYAQQWHHTNINSAAAWDITTGGVTATGDTIVVCIIENADLEHVDLTANAWINRGEIAGNGIDDDGNGYVDDRRGWNTPNNNDNVYSGGHGTQCAGMIGATGNNSIGVAGANWKVKMMPVNYGGTQEAQVIAAYTYPLVMRRMYNESAGTSGAFVVATSASWGIDGGDPNDSPLWCAMFDTLGTAGILNCGATANNAVNVDVVGDLPTACSSDFMISVTATNSADQRTFSAWGATTIDVGAPGENVLTTNISGGYGTTSGTSFACPLTAGVIGLLYSAPCATMMSLVHADPEEGARFIRQKLFEGVDQVGNLPGNTVTGGRINSGNSMELIMNSCGSCPAPFGGNVVRSGNDVTFSWTSIASGTFDVRYRAVGSTDWTEVLVVEESSITVAGLDPCVAHEFQVRINCSEETSNYSNSILLAPPAEEAPSITGSGYATFCEGSSFVLTSSVASNVVWSSGQTGPSFTPTASGSYTVTLNGLCGTYTSDAYDVTVVPAPVPPTTNSVQLPAPSATTLSATGTNITWYAAPTGGSPIGTGNTYDTPVISTTTSFWCTSSTGNNVTPAFGAKTNNTTAGAFHTQVNNWLVFTANEPFVIKSVKVYAQTAGVRPIALVDGNGNTISQGSFNIPAGESRVHLNFTVGAAGNYGLRVLSGSPQLWRDGLGSSQSFPYALGQFGNITGSTVTGANSLAYYYFFYDWEVADPAVVCESERVELVVELPTNINENTNTSLRLFPDPADRDMFIDLTGPAAQGRSLFTVIDATGRHVTSKTIENGKATITTAFLPDGMYFYRVTHDGAEVHSGRFLVSHLW